MVIDESGGLKNRAQEDRQPVKVVGPEKKEGYQPQWMKSGLRSQKSRRKSKRQSESKRESSAAMEDPG